MCFGMSPLSIILIHIHHSKIKYKYNYSHMQDYKEFPISMII